MNKNIIILGGGVTGLAAAWELQQQGIGNVCLLEASGKLGGKIGTSITEDGFVVEQGPDSYVTFKPQAVNLIAELGMEDEMISPLTSKFFILKDGQFLSPPKGIQTMVPMDKDALKETTLFSEEGKAKILEEEKVAVAAPQADESFGSFIGRRFGREMLENYAEPLFGGIYSTPSPELSMRATFPQWLAMEQKYGSLTRAVHEQPPVKQEGGRSAFMSLKNGMQSLVDRLAEKLDKTEIRLNTAVKSLEYIEETGGYRIKLENGEELTAKAIVSALPASILAGILQPDAPELANALAGFSTSGSHIVTLAYRKSQFAEQPEGTGYVVPVSEHTDVTAGTWTSNKWPDRAPEDSMLFRCFFGRTGFDKSDDWFISRAQEEMKKLLGVQGEPVHTWINHWPAALPQYKVGHLQRLAELRSLASAFPGLMIAGAYLQGVGIPDCIAQGRNAAAAAALCL